jgi:hypothetical protein
MLPSARGPPYPLVRPVPAQVSVPVGAATVKVKLVTASALVQIICLRFFELNLIGDNHSSDWDGGPASYPVRNF